LGGLPGGGGGFVGSGVVVARSATKRNFPDESITIGPGTTGALTVLLVPRIVTVSWLNGTGLPTAVVFPEESTFNVKIPVVLPGHEELRFKITYANVPAGFTTIEVGIPFNTQVRLDVSFGVLAISDRWPLNRLKLNVSISADPWLPTKTSPSDDGL
jgi:hypothetical protein